MSHQHAGNGRQGGPPQYHQPWQPPPPTPTPANGGSKLLDLSKGGLGIGMVATIAWGLFMAGQTWGTYQERGTTMQAQLNDLKADMREVKAVLARLDQRWTVEVWK